jgi:hypothetical protein
MLNNESNNKEYSYFLNTNNEQMKLKNLIWKSTSVFTIHVILNGSNK